MILKDELRRYEETQITLSRDPRQKIIASNLAAYLFQRKPELSNKEEDHVRFLPVLTVIPALDSKVVEKAHH